MSSKAILRKQLLTRRNRFYKENQARFNELFYYRFINIATILINQFCVKNQINELRIGGYYPIKSEVNALKIMQGLLGSLSQNYKVEFSLPEVTGKFQPLVFREYKFGDQLVEGAYKIQVPPKNSTVVVPNVLLVPLVGFDSKCNRIGYGAGYYDNTINNLLQLNNTNLITIGLAFSAQEVETTYPDNHDKLLDYIITETSLFQKGNLIHYQHENTLSVPDY